MIMRQQFHSPHAQPVKMMNKVRMQQFLLQHTFDAIRFDAKKYNA